MNPLFLTISLLLSTTFSYSMFQRGQAQQGLEAERTPFADLETKIWDARTCRDNYRIATNRTTVDLAAVIKLSQKCGLYAMHGYKFLVVAQNLTQYQLRLFKEYGYSVTKLLVDDDQGMPQFNITWRLPL